MTTATESAPGTVDTTPKLHCCYIDLDQEEPQCERDAEYEITDLADYTETSTIHACEEHVGPLLGHAPHVPEDAENRWEVRAL